jgi:hypothetical protein
MYVFERSLLRITVENSVFRGKQLRPILNFTPRGKPLGAKLSPGGKILCSPLHPSKHYRVFTPGGERRGEHSPQRTNFTPGDQVHPWGPGVKLTMAVCRIENSGFAES